MATERTWEIVEDVGGKVVKRTITLAEFRADIDQRKPLATTLLDAVRRGDLEAADRAQAAFRASVQP